jgi:hypothetical protein
MHAVAGLVAGLQRGGVEHVCLNKTGVERVQGGLGLLLAALQGAGPASVDVAPSDEEQWPLLELSEVRVPACACGGGPPTVCCLFDWRGGGGGRGGADAAEISLAHGSDGSGGESRETEVQQRCNRGATEVQQRCNSGATEAQQRCNRGATEVQQLVQQGCNRSSTAVMLAKAPCVLNCGGGGGGGGGWVGEGEQMPQKYDAQIALMEEVARARGVRVKTTRVETGRCRPRDRSQPVARRPPATASTPSQQGPRAAASPPPRCGSAAPAGRGTARAAGAGGEGSREAVLSRAGAEVRAPAAGNSAPGPAARGGHRGRGRGGRGGRGVGAGGAGGGVETAGGIRGWLTSGPRWRG